jgi:hypothetical protein
LIATGNTQALWNCNDPSQRPNGNVSLSKGGWDAGKQPEKETEEFSSDKVGSTKHIYGITRSLQPHE